MKISLGAMGKGRDMRFLMKRGTRKGFLALFPLFLVFLLLLSPFSVKPSLAGVLVPPPKLMYKYNPKYKNPFDPTNRSKLPPPPDKYKFNLKDSKFFRKIEQDRMRYIYGRRLINRGGGLAPTSSEPKAVKNTTSNTHLVVLPRREIEETRRRGFFIAILTVMGISILSIIIALYLRYNEMVRVTTRPLTYTKYAQRVGTVPRRRRKTLLD